jgi:hypothetical protein
LITYEEFGEGPETWADFHDVVTQLDIEEGDDRAGEILVVEEVLPEAARGVGFQFRKQSLDVAQSHTTLIAGLLPFTKTL